MLRSVLLALFLSLLPLPAAAQWEYAPGAVAQHGQADQGARALIWSRMNAPEHVKVNCWKLGCVLIVNESNYDVVGFYVDTAKPGKSVHWSTNQLVEPLQPSKATLRFKTGNPGTCNMPVRFMLVKRDTKEHAEVDGTASFCTSPHNDSLIRIKMTEGKVFVRGDDEPDPNAAQ